MVWRHGANSTMSRFLISPRSPTWQRKMYRRIKNGTSGEFMIAILPYTGSGCVVGAARSLVLLFHFVNINNNGNNKNAAICWICNCIASEICSRYKLRRWIISIQNRIPCTTERYYDHCRYICGVWRNMRAFYTWVSRNLDLVREIVFATDSECLLHYARVCVYRPGPFFARALF